jgi:hypothetical protein
MSGDERIDYKMAKRYSLLLEVILNSKKHYEKEDGCKILIVIAPALT